MLEGKKVEQKLLAFPGTCKTIKSDIETEFNLDTLGTNLAAQEEAERINIFRTFVEAKLKPRLDEFVNAKLEALKKSITEKDKELESARRNVFNGTNAIILIREIIG